MASLFKYLVENVDDVIKDKSDCQILLAALEHSNGTDPFLYIPNLRVQDYVSFALYGLKWRRVSLSVEWKLIRKEWRGRRVIASRQTKKCKE